MERQIVNPVIRDTVTFIQTAAESGGRISEMDITLMPGGANPLHYHKTYSESFLAIEGNLGLQTSERCVKILKPGEAYTVKPMQHHLFFNPTDQPIKFKITITPGHQGFENSLRIVYGMAADGLTNKNSIPRSLRHKAIIACMRDMNIPGFLTLIFPLFQRIAAKARQTGEEQRLIDKYCI